MRNSLLLGSMSINTAKDVKAAVEAWRHYEAKENKQ